MSFTFLSSLNIPLIPKDPNVNVNDKGEIITKSDTNMDSVISTLMGLANDSTLKAVDWGIIIISITFILGVIMMVLSMIFRVGQWQKFAQTTMLVSFIAILLLRAVPITILSFQSEVDVDIALSTALEALGQITIYLSITGILLSFLFKFAHKLIEHPDYHRWSKNVLNVSLLMLMFALVGPLLFGIL